MPHWEYKQEQLGHAEIHPSGPFTAGGYTSFELVYTAGFFGIDDSGSIKVVQRFAGDMSTPQFDDPKAPGYLSAEAGNGATLLLRHDIKDNIRPWGKTLYIKVVRGYLREGDRIVIRFGDRRGGSPGIRMQTFCEDTFELKVLVDAFATYEYVELPRSPVIRIVAGQAARRQAVLPTLRRVHEPFRLCLKVEDQWGNPTNITDSSIVLEANMEIAGLPKRIDFSTLQPVVVVDNLKAEEPGDLFIRVLDSEGRLLTRSNPLRIVAGHGVAAAPSGVSFANNEAANLRPYWADMHGQSEETIGSNSARDYFRFARDRAFLDVCCHQGNDFQITRKFWQELQRIVEEFNEPGRFIAFPGYEWSGNTGLGGDHNVIFLRSGEQIHRSSHALIYDLSDADSDRHTSWELFETLAGRNAFLYAHVGGRYADLNVARDTGITPAVEIHSAWGTFEWLLHDAFALSLRPGVVANSDDHKGRPGASYPGASRFGSYGGLTCFLCRELSREGVFESLRKRKHYATTGTRLYLHTAATLPGEDRPAAMGDILPTTARTVTFHTEALCSAPVGRLELFNGAERVFTFRPYTENDLGRRIRVLWEGAEYRGRGRETRWDGTAVIDGNRVERIRQINFWNPEKSITLEKGNRISWQSLTTGGFSGFDMHLEHPSRGRIRIDTPLLQFEIEIESLGLEDTVMEAGGLGRRMRIFRLPDELRDSAISVEQTFTLPQGQDNPLYAKVIQEDGHAAWSSPIYLVPG
jgi:hypothetical protein